MIVRFSALSRNVGNPIGDLHEIVVNRLLDVAVELAALDCGEDFQLLVDLGADMDTGRHLLGIAEALENVSLTEQARRLRASKTKKARSEDRAFPQCLARPEGFEPPTPWFVARYSIQMSYGRNLETFKARCRKA